jgi:hypothetical protein
MDGRLFRDQRLKCAMPNLAGAILMTERLNKSVLYTFGVGDLFFTLMINMEVYFFAAFLDFSQLRLGI